MKLGMLLVVSVQHSSHLLLSLVTHYVKSLPLTWLNKLVLHMLFFVNIWSLQPMAIDKKERKTRTREQLMDVRDYRVIQTTAKSPC